MSQPKIESLWVYPVKSCQGIRHKKLEITATGARWDRHWMIVDEDGLFLTQRQLPKMALIQTALTPRSLVLRIDNYAFEVPFEIEDHKITSVKVWKDEVGAVMEDPLVSNQLSEFLGKRVQLVRSMDDQREHSIHFADSRPVHLANLDSLAALNAKLKNPVGIERFRPNIVISGTGAFTEDSWQEINFDKVFFTVSKLCSRCTIINVDPTRGLRPDAEPLTKLKELHSTDGKPTFGILMIPKGTGFITADEE